MIYYSKKYSKKRKITLTASDILSFEKEIAEDYNKGKILGPIHLTNGNEKQLIEIFSYISKKDYVFSTWRNHSHALLHGVKPKDLKKFIYAGKSMSVSSKKPFFFASSIVTGILPIALGTALGLKKKKSKNKVWCFVGDMTAETGIFHEVHKYSTRHKLPMYFVIEDNNMSTNTPTPKVWGGIKTDFKKLDNVIYYTYKNLYPHHGTGKWVLF